VALKRPMGAVTVVGGVIAVLGIVTAVVVSGLQKASPPEREPASGGVENEKSASEAVPVAEPPAEPPAPLPQDPDEGTRLRNEVEKELAEALMRANETPPSAEQVTLRFAARVSSVKGKTLSKGSKCAINVYTTGSQIDDLDLACGKVLLYDSRTPLNGMSSHRLGLYERAKGDGWVYRAIYWDTGSRTSRNQLLLDTTSKEATAFSESGDAFSVELVVDEFSAKRVGASLVNAGPAPKKLERALTVTSESGTPPKIVGKSCKLSTQLVETSVDGPECRSELRCGGTVLYGTGTTGFGPCDIKGGAIVNFNDPKESHEDGDPSLIVEVEEGIATLSDSPQREEYSLDFALGE
jgi:hypothetical protein